MSNLPRQLQRQAEAVEQIESDLAKAKALDAPTEPVTPSEPSGHDPVTPPAPPAPPPPAEPQWQQRYLTLEGKYKAEVPRLHAELRDLKAQVAALSKPPTVEPLKVKDTAPAKTKLVTDKDSETFGPDLLDLIKRQAQDIASEREAPLLGFIDKLTAENDALKAQVTGVTKSQEVNDHNTYVAKLSALVPDWDAINVDEEFLTWLNVVDPLSGITRQAYLDNAFQALDANRTAVLFQTWKDSKVATPAAPTPPNPEIQRQVTPGKSKSQTTNVSDASTRIWAAREIEEFYNDMRAGKYRDHKDEAKRIEAEIDLAVSTARVR